MLKYPHSVTQNIHGVRTNFINIGASKIGKSVFGGSKFAKGAYFIGKALWAKGHRSLTRKCSLPRMCSLTDF